MRLPSAGATGEGGHYSASCVVCARAKWSQLTNSKIKNHEKQTRHPTIGGTGGGGGC